MSDSEKKATRKSIGPWVWLMITSLSVLVGVAGIHPQAAKGTAGTAAIDLNALLVNTAEYCRKLESVVFDFFCREEIEEIINPTLDRMKPENIRDDWTWVPWGAGQTVTTYSLPPRKINNSFLYDYQCVRSGQFIHENRTLLEENGKKTNKPNAMLKTSVFAYGNALFGPVGLFGHRFLPTYDYKIAGKDKIRGRPVGVIDVKPKQDAPEMRNLYGKAWIDAATFDILKIEWSEKCVGRYDIFRQRGTRFKREPRLTLVSEFHAEKNGIRFPSRLVIEEAYVGNLGRAFVRSETTVTYKDFKFFTVATEPHIIK
jgi:hypothetical protein